MLEFLACSQANYYAGDSNPLIINYDDPFNGYMNKSNQELAKVEFFS